MEKTVEMKREITDEIIKRKALNRYLIPAS